jgi:hypothetical protein
MNLRSALLLCILTYFAGTGLKADVINFQGASFGHFEFFGIPFGTAAGPLTYSQGPGFAGATDAAGTLELTNLGTFTLGPIDEILIFGADLIDFRLLVNFALPIGVQGGPANFFAELQGQARFQLFGDDPESVELEFANNSLSFLFQNAAGTGSFTMEVDDMTVANGGAIFENAGPKALTGRILDATFTPTPVPEPASVVLFGSAFAAMAVAMRHRQRRTR